MNTTRTPIPLSLAPAISSARIVRHVRRAAVLTRAFTLVEMLICVGAVTLIAIGLGKLFASTGRTVSVGKQVSHLAEVSAALERMIRADLAAATKEGFMVIRHKVVKGSGTGIPLSADDPNPTPRSRRVDEMVFFASGAFTSAREPQFPGRSPQGSAARIYYGHGMLAEKYQDLTLDSDPYFNRNLLSEGGWPAGLGQPGPNQYAADWILLRHVTTLARPQQTETLDPSAYKSINVPSHLRGAAWRDGPTQIGLQPASASIFRFDPARLSQPDMWGYGYETRPQTGPVAAFRLTPSNPLARTAEAAVWPAAASGLVDVASMDLTMIRARVMGQPGRLTSDLDTNSRFNPPTLTTTARSNAGYQNPNASLHLMKMMMASALPGNDPYLFDGTLAGPREPRPGGDEQRMLCALQPPDFTGSLTGNPLAANAYYQQDQAMLAASNLAVGCSEFIVEWSFGDVIPDNSASSGTVTNVGQMIWHGYPRPVPGDGAAPYRAQGYPAASNLQYTSYGFDARTQVEWTHKTNGTPQSEAIRPEVIHWPVNFHTATLPFNQNVPLYSFFGYVDPTFDTTNSPFNTIENPPGTIDWPWPRFLRFTISLVDPTNRETEQTVQFVVELPTARQGL